MRINLEGFMKSSMRSNGVSELHCHVVNNLSVALDSVTILIDLIKSFVN